MLRSFEESVSSADVFLFDFLDVHQNDGFGSTNNDDSSSLALIAFQSEGDFLGCFGLLSEDGLGLSTVTRLFAIVTSSTLGSLAFLALLVLGHLVNGVSIALSRAMGLSGLRNDNH